MTKSEEKDAIMSEALLIAEILVDQGVTEL